MNPPSVRSNQDVKLTLIGGPLDGAERYALPQELERELPFSWSKDGQQGTAVYGRDVSDPTKYWYLREWKPRPW